MFGGVQTLNNQHTYAYKHPYIPITPHHPYIPIDLFGKTEPGSLAPGVSLGKIPPASSKPEAEESKRGLVSCFA